MADFSNTTPIPTSLKSLILPNAEQEIATVRPLCPWSGLPIYEGKLPKGYFRFRLETDMHEPFLSGGQLLVINGFDTEIVIGELFLIQQIREDQVWQIRPEKRWDKLAHPERPCVNLAPLDRPSVDASTEEIYQRLRAGRIHLTDGPILLDALEPKIMGRVVGVYQVEMSS